MGNIFSFGDAVKKAAHQTELETLKDLPDNDAQIGVVVKPGDIGVSGSISEDIGKPGGWGFLAEGSWMHKAGGSVKAMLRRKSK